MPVAKLEHANITVTDPDATAAWMKHVFGWHIRWQGASKDNGRSIHVGGRTTTSPSTTLRATSPTGPSAMARGAG